MNFNSFTQLMKSAAQQVPIDRLDLGCLGAVFTKNNAMLSIKYEYGEFYFTMRTPYPVINSAERALEHVNDVIEAHECFLKIIKIVKGE